MLCQKASRLTPPAARPRVRLFNTSFDNLTLAGAADRIESWIASRDRCRIVCVKDVALAVRSRDDSSLSAFYDRVDMMVVDGRGILYASRLLGSPLLEMVGGPGLYSELVRRAGDRGYRVFLLGATQDVVEEVRQRLSAAYPRINVVGIQNGYYDDREVPGVLESLRAAAPDIVFVATATPRREKLLTAIRAAGIPSVCVAVGGVFDVEAGLARLAPAWIGRLGFEWLFRALQEPRRLLPRYVSTHSRFALWFLREFLNRAFRA